MRIAACGVLLLALVAGAHLASATQSGGSYGGYKKPSISVKDVYVASNNVNTNTATLDQAGSAYAKGYKVWGDVDATVVQDASIIQQAGNNNDVGRKLLTGSSGGSYYKKPSISVKDVYVASNNVNTNTATLDQAGSAYAKGYKTGDVSATVVQSGTIIQQAGNNNDVSRKLLTQSSGGSYGGYKKPSISVKDIYVASNNVNTNTATLDQAGSAYAKGYKTGDVSSTVVQSGTIIQQAGNNNDVSRKLLTQSSGGSYGGYKKPSISVKDVYVASNNVNTNTATLDQAGSAYAKGYKVWGDVDATVVQDASIIQQAGNNNDVGRKLLTGSSGGSYYKKPSISVKDIYVNSGNTNTNTATLTQSGSAYAKGYKTGDVSATVVQEGTIIQQAGNNNDVSRKLLTQSSGSSYGGYKKPSISVKDIYVNSGNTNTNTATLDQAGSAYAKGYKVWGDVDATVVQDASIIQQAGNNNDVGRKLLTGSSGGSNGGYKKPSISVKDIYVNSGNTNTNTATLTQSGSAYAKGYYTGDVTATVAQSGTIIQQAGNNNNVA